MKKTLAATILLAALLASCGNAGGAVHGLTAEFQQFLEIRKSRPQTSRTETLDGCAYSLEHGVLLVCDPSGEALWRSPGEWYVEDFRLGDVDGDGSADLLFTLWKSYSFGPAHPERMDNDDPAVRCHLFLYTMRAGRMKVLWGTSNLPRPIYAFELAFDGPRTPVASGAVLRTREGKYTDDFSRTEAQEHAYAWRGWGFAEE
ncbi:MAG: hypothetical protein LBB75_08055 [Oscillospiraceae bacterium]|jgi:hypothetical protein|nr:hypothetical protein [Oscillospiraceae bacterium]